MNNGISNDKSKINASEVDRILQDKDLMDKILSEQGISVDSGKKPRINLEAISSVMMVLEFFVLGVFLITPLLQLVFRIFSEGADEFWTMGVDAYTDNRRTISLYQVMIRNINVMVHLTSTIIYVICLIKVILNRKEVMQNMRKNLSKLLPLFVFILFAVGIFLVTKIRGANEYDLTGHPYMYESIYSYILYPISFFFCGMLVGKEKIRKILIYTFIFASLPLNLLALVDQWGLSVRYFSGNEIIAVFHNRNHYGYYLMLVILASAVMFVYEKKAGLKISCFVSMVIATMAIVINDSLGTFLALLFAFGVFLVYIILANRREKKLKFADNVDTQIISTSNELGLVQGEKTTQSEKQNMFFRVVKSIFTPSSWQGAVFIFATFLLVFLIMSIWYNTVLSSFFGFFKDFGDVIVDPAGADEAGSLRWGTWKKTVLHITEQPWLGYGVEGLLNTYGVGTPHNEFLQYGAFFGVPVLLLYVTAVLIVIWRVFRNWYDMSPTTIVCFIVSLGYLASSFFGVAIYYTTPFLFIFLGMTYAEYFSRKDMPKRERVKKKKVKMEKAGA